MADNKNVDVTRGYKEYDSKVKNLESIFTKIEKVLDISKYREELQQIQNDVDNDPKLSNKMLFSSMQMDYEGYVFGNYTKRLDTLTQKIEEEYLPFYELHLLSSKIDIQVSEVTAENIGDIIQNTKVLVDALNSLNTHNNKEKNTLIEKAYKTIYSVIMYEEIFDRNDALSYISHLNIPANKENLGKLLSIDLEKMNQEDLIDEDLRNIKTEGLGYDYLRSDFIRKVSKQIVGGLNSEYVTRKEQVISEISIKIKDFSEEKNKLMSQLTNKKSVINKLYINKVFLAARVLSMVLVPVITLGAGRLIGKDTSNKITEYKTITRTVNSETGEIVGDIQSIYDEKETTYVATVMDYSPWRENPTGVGYIRNVTAYEYIAPDNIEDGYHATSEDLAENVLEKYRFVESKDTLVDGDSTTDSTILITETYQDKNDNRKSTKFIIPFSIVGAGVGIAIDVTLALLGVYDLRKIKKMFMELDDEIEENKLGSQVIINILKNMKEEALLLQDEYNDVVRKYGSLEDRLSLSEIDTSWLIADNKKKIKL